MFSGRPSVRASVRDSRGSFMFPQYLLYLLTDFRQTFVTGASRVRHELIRFWGQKVKVQGHTIAAEVHSTRRYRRVQLFLVTFYFWFTGHFFCSNSGFGCIPRSRSPWWHTYDLEWGFTLSVPFLDQGGAQPSDAFWSVLW